jgi:hypothetical protein
MKNFRLSVLAIFAASLFVTSCSSSSSDSGGGGSTSGSYIHATVEGTSFKTYEVQGQSTVSVAKIGTGTDAIITISGASSAFNTMSINLQGISGTGTYTITPETDNASVLAYLDYGTQKSYDTSGCAGATATVNITAFTDEKIEGTFTLLAKDDENCTDSKDVTSGSFRGIYPN